MAGKEYYEGKDMESNQILHENLIKCLKFDSIDVRGSTTTKGDVVGIKGTKQTPISIKHGSQKNTQVHLPTLRSFAKATSMPSNVVDMMNKWLGTTDISEFKQWMGASTPNRLQQKYKRLFADDIPEWNKVVAWFNKNNRTIAELLIQAMNNETPAEYLVWVHKTKKTFKVIDIPKLIDWIETDCKWVTGPRNGGSTLRCECEGKPIFHLQMKGSGGVGDEYNHNPQFHIHINWPAHVVLFEGTVTA